MGYISRRCLLAFLSSVFLFAGGGFLVAGIVLYVSKSIPNKDDYAMFAMSVSFMSGGGAFILLGMLCFVFMASAGRIQSSFVQLGET
jgi:hypothetical protein